MPENENQDEVDAAIDSLSERIEIVETTLKVLRERLDAINYKVSNLETNLDELEDRLD
jgi:predicted nuclease with TOPRIM domain